MTTGSPSSVLSEAPVGEGARKATSSARYLGAGGTFRLEPPRLRTSGDPDDNRHATWFELFFDLVFLAALGQLSDGLADDPSARTFGRFVGLFVVVVWAWIIFALYANRFDTDDLIFRLSKSGAMLAIASIAVNLNHTMAGHGGTVGFAIAYVVARLLLIGLYVRARSHVAGEGHRLTGIYILGYSLTTGIWLISIFVPSPARFALWFGAMIFDLLIPTRAWAALSERSIVVSHLTERFGTFFILVLGGSVVGAVVGVAGFEFTWESWAVAALCFAVGLMLWWIYFDLTDTSVVRRGVLGLVFVYGHFPLLAGVAAFGAGTKLAVIASREQGLGPGARWAVAGGIAAFALSLALFHIAAESTSRRDRSFLGRLALGAFMLLLASVGGGIAPLGFVALVAAAALAQLLLEAVTPRARAAA